MKQAFLAIYFLCIGFYSLDAQTRPEFKRLYLGNDTHTDLYYNGDEEKWYKQNAEMADFYLNLGEASAKDSIPLRSKWNYDVAWTLYMLEKRTSPEYFNRIIAQIKNGQASVPYNFTLPVYGASTAEGILRSFYYGGYLERKFGIDVDIAVCQENATVPLGLASLWAGSGAKYSWKGVCNCATKTKTIGKREHEMYWMTGRDSSKIMMKWYSNNGWNAELGGYAELLEPTLAVTMMDTLCEGSRYPYRIAAAFGKGWDNMVNYAFDITWGINRRTRPGTKLYVSNELDFFHDFEDTYGKVLPSLSAAYGNEWDLLPASLAAVTSEQRGLMEQLRGAEAMAAVVAANNPTAFDNLKELKADFQYGISVWNAHGWTVDGPIKRHDFATWERLQKERIRLYVQALEKQSLQLLGAQITQNNKQSQFFVFNPLNWTRSDVADFEYEGDENIEVQDVTTGKTVKTQIIRQNGKQLLRILATDVPSVGYKTYSIKKDKVSFKKTNIAENSFKNAFYEVKIQKNGAISSLISKKSGRQMVATLLNSVEGADEANSILTIENAGEVSTTFRCTTKSPLKKVTFLTVFEDLGRIEIRNEIQQNFKDLRHWTFDFKINQPETWHEEIGAVVKAKRISEGGHYANIMTRTDYLSLNHFADVSNKEAGVTLSNANCLFMRLGNSTAEKLDGNSSTLHILAGGQVDKDKNLGIYDQDGDSLFIQNFALTAHDGAYDQASAMRFAMEHQNKMTTGKVTGEKPLLPAKNFSFLKNENPSLILWALKPGEEEGITARFWNMNDKSVNNSSIFGQKVLKSTESTHVETNLKSVPSVGFSMPMEYKGQEMKTYRVWF
jgi:alpha-mannosidase